MFIDFFQRLTMLKGTYIHQMSCIREDFSTKISLKMHFWKDLRGVLKKSFILKDPVATKGPFFGDTCGKKCVSPLPIILSLFPYYTSRKGGKKIYQYSLSKYSLTVSMVGGSEGIGTISLSR